MSAFAPIETVERLETCVALAAHQPEANERMVEAFVLAIWMRNFLEIFAFRSK